MHIPRPHLTFPGAARSAAPEKNRFRGVPGAPEINVNSGCQPSYLFNDFPDFFQQALSEFRSDSNEAGIGI